MSFCHFHQTKWRNMDTSVGKIVIFFRFLNCSFECVYLFNRQISSTIFSGLKNKVVLVQMFSNCQLNNQLKPKNCWSKFNFSMFFVWLYKNKNYQSRCVIHSAFYFIFWIFTIFYVQRWFSCDQIYIANRTHFSN